MLLVVWSLMASIGVADTRLRGVVTDSSSGAIPGAMVLIHWDSAGSTVGLTDNVGIKAHLVIRTKADGTFDVDLPSGFYDVFAAATAFSPTCRKVRMKAGETQEIKLRLAAEPPYTAEMGSRVDIAPPKR
jgi:hypothetical protein